MHGICHRGVGVGSSVAVKGRDFLASFCRTRIVWSAVVLEGADGAVRGKDALLMRMGNLSWCASEFASSKASASSSAITIYCVAPSFLVKIEPVLALWTTGVLADWAVVIILALDGSGGSPSEVLAMVECGISVFQSKIRFSTRESA